MMMAWGHASVRYLAVIIAEWILNIKTPHYASVWGHASVGYLDVTISAEDIKRFVMHDKTHHLSIKN